MARRPNLWTERLPSDHVRPRSHVCFQALDDVLAAAGHLWRGDPMENKFAFRATTITTTIMACASHKNKLKYDTTQGAASDLC